MCDPYVFESLNPCCYTCLTFWHGFYNLPSTRMPFPTHPPTHWHCFISPTSQMRHNVGDALLPFCPLPVKNLVLIRNSALLFKFLKHTDMFLSDQSLIIALPSKSVNYTLFRILLKLLDLSNLLDWFLLVVSWICQNWYMVFLSCSANEELSYIDIFLKKCLW